MVLDTGTVPPWLDYPSDKNQLWNRNTLVLMQRAGLLDIVDTPPPAGARAPTNPRSLEGAHRRRVGRVRAARDRPDPPRGGQPRRGRRHCRLRAGAQRDPDSEADSMDRIDRMFALNECWGAILSEEYAYQDVGPMHAHQVVAAACSGCPSAATCAEPSLPGCAAGRGRGDAAGPAPTR